MTPREAGAVSARPLRHLQGPPRRRTLLGLGGLAYLLLAARPATLIGFGAVAVGRALLEGGDAVKGVVDSDSDPTPCRSRSVSRW